MSMRLYAKEENGFVPHEVMLAGEGEELADALAKLTEAQAGTSNPNLLINGDFRIWQRGDIHPFAYTPDYTADRWTGSGNLAAYVNRHDLGMYREARTTGYYMGINQRIEMTVSFAQTLINKPLTLSYCLRAWAAARTYQGTNFPAYTDTVQTVTFTFTQAHYDFVSANGWSNCVIDRIGIYCLSNGAQLPVGFGCLFRWVKLEMGTVATPFVPRPYAEELVLCQRYYERMGPNHLWVAANLLFDQVFPFKVTKRINPTCTPVSVVGTLNAISYWTSSATWADYSMPTLTDVSPFGCRVGAAQTTATHFRFDLIANAEIY